MDLMDYRRKIIANSPHLASASGAIATFSDGTDLPLKSLLVHIDPVQSGTGDPSPTNIRPISGWSAVGVHNGDTVVTTISLGRTVYGGTLNPLTGELVVDKVSVDLGTLSWTSRKVGDVNAVFSSALPNQYTAKAYDTLGWLSDRYVEQISSNATILMANVDTVSVGVFSLRTSGLSDVIYAVIPKDQLPTGQLVYKLATPLTYTLDPQTVRSLVGHNNIWADTGNTSLEYWAHP